MNLARTYINTTYNTRRTIMRLYEAKGIKLNTTEIDDKINQLQKVKAGLKILANEVKNFVEGEGWNIEYFEISTDERSNNFGLYVQLDNEFYFGIFMDEDDINELWIETEYDGESATKKNYLKVIKRLAKEYWEEHGNEDEED